MNPSYVFVAELWIYHGEGAWHFVTLPEEYAPEVKVISQGWQDKGFGSVKVSVSVEGISWSTSLFPDRKSGSYILPVKKEIRSRLNVGAGDKLSISLRLSDV
jgi:hypothetical protein